MSDAAEARVIDDGTGDPFLSDAAKLALEIQGPKFGLQDTMGGGGDDAMFASAETVSMDELDEQRGGFVIDGLDIRLGAQIQTLVNGELALMTSVSWTDMGVETSRFVSDALSTPTPGQLQGGLLSTGSITMNIGDATVFLANNGQTALIQNVETGLQNIIINTAHNTDIQTQVNATIDLSGYAAFQVNVQNGNLSSYLGMAIDQATIGIVSN